MNPISRRHEQHANVHSSAPVPHEQRPFRKMQWKPQVYMTLPQLYQGFRSAPGGSGQLNVKDPTSNFVALALPPLTGAASWAVLLLSAMLILAPQARAEALLWLHGCLYGMLGVLVLLGDWRAGNLSKNFSQLFRDRIKASVETWALIAGGLALIVT